MKRKIINMIIVILFFCGLVVFLYPTATHFFSKQKTSGYIADFNKVTQSLRQPSDGTDGFVSDKELSNKLYADMQAYNADIYEVGQANLKDPFSYEQAAFDLTQYGLLDNIAGYVTIPGMRVELPIYLGASTENLAKGAASLGQTSLPVGGINTNTVLAAHRGYKGIAMFRDIESLEIGDKIYITNLWETMVYEVAETKIILPGDMGEIFIQPGCDLVTLITCHPYAKNYQRYIVYCKRTTEENKDKVTAGTDSELSYLFKFNELTSSQQLIFLEYWLPIAFIAVLLLLIIARTILWIIHKKKEGPH